MVEFFRNIYGSVVKKIREKVFTFRFISQMIQDMAIVTMEDEYELVCGLSFPVTLNDPPTQIMHASFLNI